MEDLFKQIRVHSQFEKGSPRRADLAGRLTLLTQDSNRPAAFRKYLSIFIQKQKAKQNVECE